MSRHNMTICINISTKIKTGNCLMYTFVFKLFKITLCILTYMKKQSVNNIFPFNQRLFR